MTRQEAITRQTAIRKELDAIFRAKRICTVETEWDDLRKREVELNEEFIAVGKFRPAI